MNNCYVKPDYLNTTDKEWIEYCTNVGNISALDLSLLIESIFYGLIFFAILCFFVYYVPKIRNWMKIFNKGGV